MKHSLASIARILMVLAIIFPTLPQAAGNGKDVFSDIVFIDENGKDASLAQFKGKVIALHFWATWCPPCVEEMPALDRAAGEFGKKGMVFVALSQDFKGVPLVKKFYEKNNIKNLKPYADIKTRSYSKMRLKGLPATVFITPDGKIIDIINGSLLWDKKEVRETLGRILKTHSQP